MTYSFKDSLGQGETGEEELDRHFEAKGYTIKPVSMELQRLGIDRIFIDERGVRQSVEYKSDDTAARTGNAFIETVSVDTDDIKGWSYTCCAQYLVYYVPPTGSIYMVLVTELKKRVAGWEAKYPYRRIPNRRSNGSTYFTEGFLVPLEAEIEPVALWTVNPWRRRGSVAVTDVRQHWPQIIGVIRGQNLQVAALLNSTWPVAVKGGELVIGADAAFHRDMLSEPKRTEIVSGALHQVLSCTLQPSFVLQER